MSEWKIIPSDTWKDYPVEGRQYNYGIYHISCDNIGNVLTCALSKYCGKCRKEVPNHIILQWNIING